MQMRKSQQGASYIAILFGVILFAMAVKQQSQFGQHIGMIKLLISKFRNY
jgi:hypothetical protein